MVSWIKDWSQGVIVAVILATILEMLLPNNKNKKYITSIIGIFILFSIISPIISRVTGKNIKLEDYIDTKNITSTNYTMDNVALLESDSNVEDLYINTLKKDITNTVKSNAFCVNSISIDIQRKSEKNYGEILGITLNVSPENDNTVSIVEEVNIDTSLNQKKNNVSEGRLNVLKEILMETYGISKDKIAINK